MLDIKEEIQIILLRKRLSMRKAFADMQAKGYDIPSGLSNSIHKKRVRFETVQEILDYLGYEIVIREK